MQRPVASDSGRGDIFSPMYCVAARVRVHGGFIGNFGMYNGDVTDLPLRLG